MGKTIEVTPSQVNAARLLAKQAISRGDVVPPAIAAIANATLIAGSGPTPARQRAGDPAVADQNAANVGVNNGGVNNGGVNNGGVNKDTISELNDGNTNNGTVSNGRAPAPSGSTRSGSDQPGGPGMTPKAAGRARLAPG
jgi:hypothetical protein